MNVFALSLLAVLPLALQDDVPPPLKAPPIPKPADFPEPLRPYIDAATGLEGLEFSLTLQVGLSIGLAVELDGLPAGDQANAQNARSNWKYILKEALIATAKQPTGSLVGGGLFYDTGMRVDPTTSSFELHRPAEFRLEAVRDVGAIVSRRQLVGGLRAGLSKDDARALIELLEPLTGDGAKDMNPWLMHATTHAMFMSIGSFDSYAQNLKDSGTPFGTWEEFQERVIAETTKALVDPLRPKLGADLTKNRNFRYEGEFVLQIVDPKAETDGWAPPKAVIEANRADHSPTLLVQVPPRKKVTHKTQFDRITIGMVAGGEHRVIYDGRWPIR